MVVIVVIAFFVFSEGNDTEVDNKDQDIDSSKISKESKVEQETSENLKEEGESPIEAEEDMIELPLEIAQECGDEDVKVEEHEEWMNCMLEKLYDYGKNEGYEDKCIWFCYDWQPCNSLGVKIRDCASNMDCDSSQRPETLLECSEDETPSAITYECRKGYISVGDGKCCPEDFPNYWPSEGKCKTIPEESLGDTEDFEKGVCVQISGGCSSLEGSDCVFQEGCNWDNLEDKNCVGTPKCSIWPQDKCGVGDYTPGCKWDSNAPKYIDSSTYSDEDWAERQRYIDYNAEMNCVMFGAFPELMTDDVYEVIPQKHGFTYEEVSSGELKDKYSDKDLEQEIIDATKELCPEEYNALAEKAG